LRVCVRVCVSVCMCMYACVCVCVYVCTHTSMYFSGKQTRKLSVFVQGERQDYRKVDVFKSLQSQLANEFGMYGG